MLSNSWRASSGARMGVRPRLTTWLGPAHDGGGVAADHLADHEPVEQHADRGEVLLDRGLRVGFAELLDVGGDVHRLEAAELAQAPLLAPAEELARPPGRRLAGYSGCGCWR